MDSDWTNLMVKLTFEAREIDSDIWFDWSFDAPLSKTVLEYISSFMGSSTPVAIRNLKVEY